MGWKGSCNPADANVFSGTFDGKGHVISGLDIRLEGSIEGEKYGQVGLSSIIGSDRADDFAEVKNLIFSNVSVSVDFSNELAAVGTLAGEVNGYARVSNVVVVSGKITVNPSKSCDTVGAGGIVGRIAQSACGAVTRCVNTGTVQYEGNDAYGIAAAANRNAALLATVSDCYFLDTAGTSLTDGARGLSEKEMSDGTLWGGLADGGWQAVKGCYGRSEASGNTFYGNRDRYLFQQQRQFKSWGYPDSHRGRQQQQRHPLLSVVCGWHGD